MAVTILRFSFPSLIISSPSPSSLSPFFRKQSCKTIVVTARTTTTTVVFRSLSAMTTATNHHRSGNEPTVADIEDFHKIHEESMARAESTYSDPATGFTVFTELTHLKRGKCCGNKCRHCPYGFEKVRPPGGHRKGSWRNRRKNSTIDPGIPPPPMPLAIPGAPTAKLRSGDTETAQRMVQEIFEKAGKEDDSPKLRQKPAAIVESDDDDDLSLASSSSSYSSTSTEASDDESINSTNKPTTITVVEALNDSDGFSTETKTAKSKTTTETLASIKSIRSAATTASNTTVSSNGNGKHLDSKRSGIPLTATTTTPTKNVPYTRSGDTGTSQLGTGERRSKTDDAFEAMGTVDELCSFVGVAHSHLLISSRRQKVGGRNTNYNSVRRGLSYGDLPVRLLDVMSRLFDVGSHVAKPPPVETVGKAAPVFVPNGIGDGFDANHVDDLEEWINEMTEDLPELTSFILPTGAPASAALHVARTVCRRAERRLVPLVVDHGTCDPNALRYLNRLSDFFFVSARWVNYKEGQEEIEYRLDIYDDNGEGDNDDLEDSSYRGEGENASNGGGHEDQRGRVHRSLAAPSEQQ